MGTTEDLTAGEKYSDAGLTFAAEHLDKPIKH